MQTSIVRLGGRPRCLRRPSRLSSPPTVDTFRGAKTITVDPKTHNVYLFQPERGPAPPPPPNEKGKGKKKPTK